MCAMICMSCGNTEEFDIEIRGTTRIDGDSEDFVDDNVTDLEEEGESPICVDCGNDYVKRDLSPQARRVIIWQHTTKEGEWSEEEADEKDRDEILGQQIVEEAI